jgi:hypothetical protein
MNEMSSPQVEHGELPGGNPMNLTCTTAASAAGNAGTTYTIVLVGPAESNPVTPPGSTTIISPNGNVEWQLTGTGPNGNPVPPGFKLTGVLVYSTP